MSRSLQMKINVGILVALILSFIFRPFLIAIGLLATIPVVISAINSIRNKKVSVDLLASIALFASILHREWASIVFINLMITSARIFGDYTESKADDAIKSLLKLRPEIVKVKRGTDIVKIGIADVKIGDLIIIETGDRVPVDGTIIEGTGNIDESSLTGESIPLTKTVNQKVFSSTLNLTGSFILKTEKVGSDTTFEKIISLIQSAQSDKKGIQTTADKFASFYIVITLVVSIILFAVTQNLNLILSILLVACADDIAIAIPMAYWGALAKAAKAGVIIKGASFLEGLTEIKTVILDKTGTLTKGSIKTQNLICFGDLKAHELLRILANVESVSEHPIAKAITRHAVNDGLKIKTPEKFEEFAGYGIKAYEGKRKIIAGNLKFLKKENVEITKEELKIAEEHQKNGFLVVYLAINKQLAGIVTLADQIRPESTQTIAALRSYGIKNIIMLTGDNELVAERVARLVGISEFHANLLPQDKLEFIRKMKDLKPDEKIAMIGDGVNDAASLKLADIGIAMGAIGSDAAIDAADIALMQDNLSKLITAIELATFTKRIAKGNFIIWGVINVAGLFLVFTSLIGPQGAATWNFVTDFFPIANSLRVLRRKVIN